MNKKGRPAAATGAWSFCGKVDRVYEKLSIADLMLMPSEMESFGLAAALEGMACELPTIATSVGGVPQR